MKWQNLPPYLFYPALIPHIIALCVRYRASIALITKANPAFPFGGLPFASKNEMFQTFDRVLPYTLIAKGTQFSNRLNKSKRFAHKVGFPLIAKPDTGHRGLDVHLIYNQNELTTLLRGQQWDYLLQAYSRDPYEFGIFYCRKPGEESGRIVSMTQKVIPTLIGNGKDTIAQLILKSDIENKKVILEHYKNTANEILGVRELLKTLVVASHCQGAMFFDAKKLVTPKLRDAVEELCHKDGFYFGRLDVKSPSIPHLNQGKFEIIEVNGATSEFIHVYDQSYSYRRGLSDLKLQWSLLFEVADLNRGRPENEMSMRDFLKRYVLFFLESRKVTGRFW